MTDLTDEAVKALLDGATPGPWRADGEPWNRIVWSSADNRVCFMAHSSGLNDARDTATSNLVAAAPDLARALLDARAEHAASLIRINAEAVEAVAQARADAQAAVALALEEAAENKEQLEIWAHEILVGLAFADVLKIDSYNDKIEAHDMVGRGLVEVIRDLAPIDGLALVRELRAERDALKKKLISPDPYEDTAHPDDHAVNRFAAVMKGKLAAKRLQGRGGWQEPEVPNGYLSRMLREHVDKGDPVDVANLAMMIHQRGERIAPQNEGASCKAIDDAIAERDRLAAANAVLEAKVAGCGRCGTGEEREVG